MWWTLYPPTGSVMEAGLVPPGGEVSSTTGDWRTWSNVPLPSFALELTDEAGEEKEEEEKKVNVLCHERLAGELM